MIKTLGNFWCKFVHTGIYYAGGSHYTCRACFREYRVSWSVGK